MDLVGLVGVGADVISAALCFCAPMVLGRLLSERQFTAHRGLVFWMTLAAVSRGVLHVALTIDAWVPCPKVIAVSKMIAALALIALAYVIVRRVSAFFQVVDQARTEREYEAVIGILKRLRTQARRHGHP